MAWTGHRIVYDVKANWKLIVQNYNECLHCPQIHPELVQVIPLYRKGEVWDGETIDGGKRRSALCGVSGLATARSASPSRRAAGGGERSDGRLAPREAG